MTAGAGGAPGGGRGQGPKKHANQRPRRSLEVRTSRDAVKAALQFHGISDAVRAQRVHAEWSDLVGPRIASRTRPFGINERTLIIDVASSAWLHELNLLRVQILAGLIERLGPPRLFDELKFKLAGRTGTSLEQPRARARPAPPARPPRIPATGLTRERIAKEVESVDDLELRALIARVRIDNDR